SCNSLRLWIRQPAQHKSIHHTEHRRVYPDPQRQRDNNRHRKPRRLPQLPHSKPKIIPHVQFSKSQLPQLHSFRSAIIGSICAARHAGTRHAVTPTTSSKQIAPRVMAGLNGLIPNKRLPTTRPNPNASPTPAIEPKTTRNNPSRKTNL